MKLLTCSFSLLHTEVSFGSFTHWETAKATAKLNIQYSNIWGKIVPIQLTSWQLPGKRRGRSHQQEGGKRRASSLRRLGLYCLPIATYMNLQPTLLTSRDLSRREDNMLNLSAPCCSSYCFSGLATHTIYFFKLIAVWNSQRVELKLQRASCAHALQQEVCTPCDKTFAHIICLSCGEHLTTGESADLLGL